MLARNTGPSNRVILFGLLAFACTFATGSAKAASPVELAAGRALFERQWVANNPKIQSDGLGPLFNNHSCVACHHQGGIGGSGDARFNARTVGIEEIRMSPGMSREMIAPMVGAFHPGFLADGNNIISTMTLHHHGGTEMFASSRSAILSQLSSLSDPAGGPRDAAEVRQETGNPIHYYRTHAKQRIDLQARIFQRNTTALFGAGLIDAVPIEAMKEQMRLQKRHPEINGRPATLSNGEIGKFGWRANVATLRGFTDQACANELGLRTRMNQQPADPTAPGYHNPGYDIDGQQIKAMRHFIAALPAPVRAYPESSQQRQIVQQGENLFASIGCAVCHTPTLGPAEGIYSDLLLHDMGYPLRDLNAADPYIVRSVVRRSATVVSSTMTANYYGTTTSFTSGPEGVTVGGGQQDFSSRGGNPRILRPSNYPDSTVQFIPLGSKNEEVSDSFINPLLGPGLDNVVNRSRTVQHQVYIRHTIEPTPVTQEWRTAPLWGLRDSAPYMHDGRAATVLEAIALHGGEASGTRDRFLNLSIDQRDAILAFLDTLVAPH